jgi:hypothetical protein
LNVWEGLRCHPNIPKPKGVIFNSTEGLAEFREEAINFNQVEFISQRPGIYFNHC